MNRNFFIAGVILLVFLAGVFIYRQNLGKNSQQMTSTTETQPTAGAKAISAEYMGKLPCADCEGIDAVLTIYTDQTYKMSNTYLGRDVAPYVEEGTVTTLKGDATDPNATVYQLKANQGSSAQNYLVSGNELQQLDQDLKPIDAPFNTSLTKKSSE